MQNATKALIIASAVLITILIISLGLFIYSKSNSADQASSTLGEMEVMSFNEQYRPYEGTRSGGEVKALLQKASQHNQELYQSQDTIKYCVCIRSNVQDILNYFSKDAQMFTGLNGSRSYGVRYPSNIAQISEGVSQTKKYKVWFSYNDYGYIWEIHVDNV